MSAQTTTGGVPERKVPPNSIRGAAMRGVVARPGHEAVEVKGWLRAHKWLLLRRASQLGILALGAVRRQPWEHRGEIALRDVMTLSLSFDHRLVDGEQGARFLRDVADVLREPGRAMLLG